MAVLTKVEPNGRRLVRHLSVSSASPRASDRLTRRRKGAEMGSAAEVVVSRDAAGTDGGQRI